jgi:hypothetical protein
MEFFFISAEEITISTVLEYAFIISLRASFLLEVVCPLLLLVL